MLFVCYTPKFPENPEPNRTNRDLGRSCSVSSRSIGCSSRFGLSLGREVKNLIGIGLNPRTDTEHRAVSVHSQACTGQTPFYLNYGYHPKGTYCHVDTKNPHTEDHVQYLIRLQEAAHDAINDA